MPRLQSVTLDDLTSVATTAAVSIASMETKDMYVMGTFVGTCQPQVSPDGTNWLDVGAALTAPAIVALPSGALFARLDCTAYTSGTISSAVTGRDEDA